VARQGRQPGEEQLREAARRTNANDSCDSFVLSARYTNHGFERVQVRSDLTLQFVGGGCRRQASRQAIEENAVEPALDLAGETDQYSCGFQQGASLQNRMVPHSG
jgi:hypothetical protein